MASPLCFLRSAPFSLRQRQTVIFIASDDFGDSPDSVIFANRPTGIGRVPGARKLSPAIRSALTNRDDLEKPLKAQISVSLMPPCVISDNNQRDGFLLDIYPLY